MEDVQENADRHKNAYKPHHSRHSSVSSRAWRRKVSSSDPVAGTTPAGAAGAGRSFHSRTINAVVTKPKTRARKGMIQARRLKSEVVGAAITVVPYIWTNACVI